MVSCCDAMILTIEEIKTALPELGAASGVAGLTFSGGKAARTRRAARHAGAWRRLQPDRRGPSGAVGITGFLQSQKIRLRMRELVPEKLEDVVG